MNAMSERARRVAQTRESIRDAALKLFAERGYERVTVDEIADAAGVARRTFFRYFPAKEAVLFSRQARDIEAFSAAIAASRERGVVGIHAVREALLAMVPMIEADRDAMVTRQAIVDASPVLFALENADDQEWERSIAGALALGGWGEIDAALAAGLLIGLVNATLREWRRREPPPPLAELATRALDVGAVGLARWDAQLRLAAQ